MWGTMAKPPMCPPIHPPAFAPITPLGPSRRETGWGGPQARWALERERRGDPRHAGAWRGRDGGPQARWALERAPRRAEPEGEGCGCPQKGPRSREGAGQSHSGQAGGGPGSRRLWVRCWALPAGSGLIRGAPRPAQEDAVTLTDDLLRGLPQSLAGSLRGPGSKATGQ